MTVAGIGKSRANRNYPDFPGALRVTIGEAMAADAAMAMWKQFGIQS